MNHHTAYSATRNIINPRLVQEGLKVIPPQMMYTYYKKGYVNTIEQGGQKLASEKVINEWLEGYVAKKKEGEARKAKEVEEQLAGK